MERVVPAMYALLEESRAILEMLVEHEAPPAWLLALTNVEYAKPLPPAFTFVTKPEPG
jgi:hypothetical protein